MADIQAEIDPSLLALRRNPMDRADFDARAATYGLMCVAEQPDLETNPQAYTKDFDERYEQAKATMLRYRNAGETRVRISQDENGERTVTPVTPPDLDDIIMELYDRLEAQQAPIITLLEQVRQQGILHGHEYITTLRLCVLMAGQNLPELQE